MQRRLAPLFSLAAGAVHTGHIEVVRGAVLSVARIVEAYLQLRRKYGGRTDPVLEYVSNELFALAQVANASPSAPLVSEVVRTLARVSRAAVEASQVDQGWLQQNLGILPLSYLGEIAVANLANRYSNVADLATRQIGDLAILQWRRRRYTGVLFTIKGELQRLLNRSLQPFCYHVGGTAGASLMRVWSDSCAQHDDFYVRSAIREVIENFLPATSTLRGERDPRLPSAG